MIRIFSKYELVTFICIYFHEVISEPLVDYAGIALQSSKQQQQQSKFDKSRPCLMQSNALDKSIKIVPMFSLLSKLDFHFSSTLTRVEHYTLYESRIGLKTNKVLYNL